MNNFLNEAVKASLPHTNPGRIPLSYAHKKERDTFYEVSPSELPPVIRQNLNPRHKPRVRVTTDQRTGEVLAKIVKCRVADLDIVSPRTWVDFRISVNLEISYDGEVNHLPVIEMGGGKARDRNKDRMSYRHLAYQVDLTQVANSEVCILPSPPSTRKTITNMSRHSPPKMNSTTNSKSKYQRPKSAVKDNWPCQGIPETNMRIWSRGSWIISGCWLGLYRSNLSYSMISFGFLMHLPVIQLGGCGGRTYLSVCLHVRCCALAFGWLFDLIRLLSVVYYRHILIFLLWDECSVEYSKLGFRPGATIQRTDNS